MSRRRHCFFNGQPLAVDAGELGSDRVAGPWFSNRTKSIVKSPKLYFGDVGLLYALLNIRSEEALRQSYRARAAFSIIIPFAVFYPQLRDTFFAGKLRQQKSYAMEIATKSLIMASEISGLEPLRGFIKQENRVVPIRFQLARKRGGQPEFVARKLPQPVPRPEPDTLTTLPPKKPAASATKPAHIQATLPLFDQPDGKREGFVWDASKEVE